MNNPTPSDRSYRIGRSENVLEELRKATREANEAAASLRLERQRCKELVENYLDHSLAEISGALDAAVREQMELLSKHTKKAISQAYEKTISEFDKIKRILLGQEQGDEDPDLIETSRHIRAAMNHVRYTQESEIPPIYRRPK